MTHRLLQSNDYKNIVVVFANTGQEDEGTLQFVKDCDDKMGFNTVWVEADVQFEARKGTKHKVVDFATASRKGEPYEDTIKKFGIPNQISPHCTREMKQRPITSYARSIGWGLNKYHTAIGIRIDEIDRMNSRADEVGIVYPLVKWKISKQDVLDFWSKQNFDLMIPEHRGNCTWCWKKSARKLYTLAKEEPELFDFPSRMEDSYSMVGATAQRNGKPMHFFRGHKTAKDILSESKVVDFKTFVDQRYLDMQNGCEDSCEVFSTESDIEGMLNDS